MSNVGCIGSMHSLPMPTSEAIRRRSSLTLWVTQRVTPKTSSYQASSASMSSLMWMTWKF